MTQGAKAPSGGLDGGARPAGRLKARARVRAELNEIARQTEDVDKASHALLYLGKAHTRLRAAAAGIGRCQRPFNFVNLRPIPQKPSAAAECHELLSQCYIQQVQSTTR